MGHRVGRLTLAVTLIAMGAVLIADNVWETEIVGYAVRLWPALLILLGLEWVAAAGRAQPDYSRIRVDGGAVVLLVIVGLIMANTASWRNSPFRQFTVEMPVMPPQMVPRTFGSTWAEMVLTGGGPVDGLQELTIDGGPGDIAVEAGDEFRVELTVRGYGSFDAEALENARRVQLQVQPGPGARVYATRPADTVRVDLHFRVIVPPGVRVNAESTSGAIDIGGRQANVSALTVSGAVIVRDVEGDVAITSTSGSVRLWLPASASVSVDARTSSGRVSGPPWLTLGEGRGSGTGQQGDGAHKMTLRTSSGDINIAVP